MTTVQEQFIEKIAPLAQQVQDKYGVPASLVIAQAANETGWGQIVKGNNYFGIKAGSQWKGDVQNISTHEFIHGEKVGIKDIFRSYDSLAASVDNFGKFLVTHSRYAAVIHAGSARQAADEMQRAGYGTDPEYAKKLKSVIASNHLTRFDDPKFKNYEIGDDFAKNQERLAEERQKNPSVWDDFLNGVMAIIQKFFQNIFGAAGVNATGVVVNHHEAISPPPPTPSASARSKA